MTDVVPGRKQLAEYKAKQKLTHAQMGDVIGCSAPMAKALVLGERTPSLVMAAKIERKLGIVMIDWVPE